MHFLIILLLAGCSGFPIPGGGGGKLTPLETTVFDTLATDAGDGLPMGAHTFVWHTLTTRGDVRLTSFDQEGVTMRCLSHTDVSRLSAWVRKNKNLAVRALSMASESQLHELFETRIIPVLDRKNQERHAF